MSLPSQETGNSIMWRCLPMGEGALLLEADPPTPLANRIVLALAEQLALAELPGVESAVPAIASLLVVFDPLRRAPITLRSHLEALLSNVTPAPARPERVVEVPVRYGGDAGPDLEAVAALLALPPAQVVALHCAEVYRVMMIGFAPGFPYIGPLPAALNLPRRSTPRTAVPAGSVALAAGLTGIYPARLPGGWHVIGRTERRLFDPHATPPALLAAGDGVRFVPLGGGVLP